MDTLAIDLARFQFAFTISAHIIFPAFSIGLASYLAVLEALWLWRGDEVYLRARSMRAIHGFRRGLYSAACGGIPRWLGSIVCLGFS